MAGKALIRIGRLGVLALVLAPASGMASQLNITSVTPVRPQIYLSPSLNMDVRSRTVYDLDISQNCSPDERVKKRKRDHRCRRDR